MRKAVSALGAVGLVLTMYAFPPLQDYLFALQGYGVVCREPAEQVVLPSEEGSSAFARYQIANITSSAIQVAGLTSSCPCVSPVNLPLDIPPHEKCDLIIKVNGGCKAGETNRYYATLLLSQRGHPIQVTPASAAFVPRTCNGACESNADCIGRTGCVGTEVCKCTTLPECKCM